MNVQKSPLIFLVLLLASIIVVSFFSTGFAQQGQFGTSVQSPQFLAIQHAQSGTISEINSTSFLLQLNDLADKSILFSDRPDRVVVTQGNQDFIGNWTSGQESLRIDPPNAVLVTDDQKEDTIEIELYNPKYENEGKKISYDFTLLGNTTAISDLPKKLGKSVLIIDSFPTAVNSQITD
ncbi:MAG TPA: hypothetical protein VJ599_05885 [Nitrososphaeraceae archaeon]|nr:hypothetical protein [Nitrososphaeraceae archaeon]